MQNFVKDRYEELLEALDSARLPHIAQPFDEKGLECIADYYFAKDNKTDEAKEKAEAALNRFALNFDRELYNESYSLQREAAGKLLADFLYHFHVHAAVKHKLTKHEGYSALKSLANDLIPKISIRDDGRAAYFERLNFNRKVEKILSFKANEKDSSHLEKFVAQFNSEIAQFESEEKPDQIKSRENEYFFASMNFSHLFEVFFTDNYMHGERVEQVTKYLTMNQNESKYHYMKLVDFIGFLESKNHAEMNLEFSLARGKFYKVMRSLCRDDEASFSGEEFKKYRNAIRELVTARNLLTATEQETLRNAINAKTPPTISVKELYKTVHPEQQTRPKGMPASAIMIGLTAITYGIRKVVSWMSFSMYKFSNQKDVRAWLNREKRHYIAENWSFNSWKPAVFWALTTAVAIGFVFGGLATAGILPLSMTLFTFPLWVPLMGGTGPSLGLMLLTSIIPTASSIAGKIASFFYKDDVERSVEDELDFGDMQALVNQERKKLVLDERESPSTQPESVNPEEEHDIDDDLRYSSVPMRSLKSA